MPEPQSSLAHSAVTFSLNHGLVHGFSLGEPTAPVILCLHGWLDNAGSFIPLMQSFCDLGLTQQHHFVVVDLPGHGLSEHKAGMYHFADWIDDVYQLLVALGPRPVILLGHSLGALVACCVAAAFPERVSQLIMLEGAGPLTQSSSTTTSHLRQAILSRQKNAPVKPRALSQLQQAKAKALGLTVAQVHEIVSRGVKPTEYGMVWSHDPKLTWLSPVRFAEPQAQQIIKDIQCPTLVILGEQGYLNIKQQLLQRMALFQRLTQQTLAGNHHLHLQNNQQVAAAIKEFLVTL
ncbi:alpha/beta fold hydrolase [Motilimonas sp. KMU-193]|uniref:alpha/beta fold hydrolase n=1 Tax=Motilimonas sp. KMU-193 TaxID=3388668 RepID=UPI00396B325F